MTPAEQATAEKKETVTITVDGRDVEAKPGELLIAAAERSGVYIPRFCYHPRMKPVGMCRMCLVNVEGPRGVSMQVSCMLTVSEGMKVDTQAPDVKKAQDGVLEFLLVNHPLDCPVCDKGGECPLQDQTLTFGPGESRFVEEKRHFEKPIEISPLVALDRERCILCDRCTRFSKDVAGDPLIHFQNRGNETQVNVFPEHPFSSYFSGNTVQICPVGALTATPYRFKARPWDLEQAESTCTSCAVGCRVAVQSSNDHLTRYLGVDADATNHGWMCDKGRFDFEALNSERRFSTPLMRVGNALAEATWSDALNAAALALSATTATKVGFIGGARLANEDQYAWTKLAKAVVGTDNVDAQLGDGLPADSVLGVPRATIDDACNAKAVVLLAPDLKEELPVLYLRLREAIVDKGLPVIELSPQPTSITPLAVHHLAYRAGDASAAAAALVGKGKADIAQLDEAAVVAARKTLTEAGDVVVIFGRQSMAESSQAIADAVGVLHRNTNAKFLPALRRSNVLGALDMGLAPGVLPGRVSLDDGRRWYGEAWGKVPAKTGLDTGAMLQAAANGELDTLVLLGSDPLQDFPDRDLAHAAFDRVKTIVSVDILPNASSSRAHVVLPAAAYAERAGTTTNIEGRISRLGPKVTAPGVAWSDWMIAVELAQHLGSDLGLESLEDIWAEIEALAPSHRGITLDVLTAKANRDGVVVPLVVADANASTNASTGDAASSNVRRPAAALPPPISYDVANVSAPPGVDGYSLRLVSSRKLYDLGTLTQLSPHLAELAAITPLRVHSSMLAPLGIESGGRVRIRNAKATAVLPVEADDRVPRNVAVWTWNVGTPDNGAVTPASFIEANQSVTNIRLETP